ncbi:MAG: hypothetical protein QM692_15090 [Thermomicrobiales bacterium]
MTSTWKRLRSFTKGMIGRCAVWLALGLYIGFPGLAMAQGVTIPAPTVATNDLWLVVYGLLTALVVNWLKQLPPNFTPWQKRGVAAFIAAVFAIVSLWYANSLDLADLSRTWLVIFLVASGLYTAVLRPATDAVSGKQQT